MISHIHLVMQSLLDYLSGPNSYIPRKRMDPMEARHAESYCIKSTRHPNCVAHSGGGDDA